MFSVIIPALLKTAEDQFLLEQTLRKIPWQHDDELVLVTQGRRPFAQLLDVAPSLRWIHFDAPQTKWGAIDAARRQLSATSSKIVLLDADDPIYEDSLRHAWNRIEEDDFDLLIGDRSQIALRATDELSPRSRLYTEIFSNALVLIQLGGFYSEGNSYPDIQSGFYSIRSEIFKLMDLKSIGAYGGELALYHYLVRSCGRVESTPIETRPSEVSNYDLKRIINDIFSLPFLADLDQRDIQTAKAVSPLMYARYLEPGEDSRYTSEIEAILALRGQP